ncbi:MAG: PEGA domain-containing protein [Spirochaetaceae bacterium]
MIFRNKEKIDASHINITLKPFLNIKPQIYIPIIYSVIFAIVFFTIIILPGILKNGTELNITSTPGNASVYIDDVRIGSTPLKVFVEKGKKTILIKKDNFIDVLIDKKVRGKLFFSLFNKKREDIHTNLLSKNGKQILENAYLEMSRWSLINNKDVKNRYRIPSLLSLSVKDYYRSTDFDKKTLDNYLLSSIKLVTNENIFSDYLRAIMISESDYRLPSISSIKNSIIFVNNIVEENPNTPLLLYNEILKDIKSDNKYYKLLTDRHRKIINKNVISFEDPKDDVDIGSMTFKYIPNSNITPYDVNFIHNITEESFYISELMVSKENYLDFVSKNPEWNTENKDSLVSDKLVDNYYLSFENSEEYITNVSYFAALAWCKWANSYYEIPEGWIINLPTENMWFSAVLYGINLNVEAWQWTDQGFYLYDHFLTNNNGVPITPFTDITPRLVVGENKYNTKAESGRGVQEANWCTPFLSFRPVLVKE